MVKSIVGLLASLVLASGLAGCQSLAVTPVSTAANIVGTWEGELNGYPVRTVYTGATVAIAGFDPVAYTLDGDLLVVAGDPAGTRRVAFGKDGTMQQTDTITGSVLTLRRVD